MIDPEIQRLLDSPLGDDAQRINKPWLPAGKRSAPRSAKPEYYAAALPSLTGKEARQRASEIKGKRMGALLTYYASTDIPLDRIVQHTGLSEDVVVRALRDRGRDA